MKGTPVVAYNTGGIPLQLIHGIDGFLCDRGDVESVAKYVEMLVVDPELRKTMSVAASRYRSPNFSQENRLNVVQGINYLYMFNNMLLGGTGLFDASLRCKMDYVQKGLAERDGKKQDGANGEDGKVVGIAGDGVGYADAVVQKAAKNAPCVGALEGEEARYVPNLWRAEWDLL
jgi:hypothetical protein